MNYLAYYLAYFLPQLYRKTCEIPIVFQTGLRKFTFGNNGVESTHDALIKYQAMTFGFNITLFCIRSKPSFSSGQTPAYSSWLCF